MNRDDVIAKDQQRRGAETVFKGNLVSVRRELSPRMIASRLIQSQKRKLEKRANIAKRFSMDNSRWLIAGGLFSVLIATRLPILERLKSRKLKDSNSQMQE
jgi:hypothetical protein